MNYIKLLAICGLLVTASSCSFRYTPVQNTNFSQVDFSQVKSFDKGKSCKRYLLGLIPIPSGQPSLINATKNGKLSKVEVVDYENSLTLLPPGTKSCLIAYGSVHRK